MKKRTNIGFFTFGLLSYSGAAAQAMKVANTLENYQVIFFNKEPDASIFFHKSILHKGYQVIILQKFLPFRFISIAYNLVKNKIRICHFHCFGIRNMIPCLLLGCRLILKTTLLGEDDFATQLGSRKKKLTRLIVSKIKYNVVLTKHIQQINQQYIAPEKVRIIYNGIAVQEHPKPKTGNVFCYIGLVCLRKRTYNAILYFAENYAHLNEATLFIIGPNNVSSNLSEFSQAYYDSCIELVNQRGLQSQVIFTGNIPPDKVFEIYHQAKSIIFLSSKEGFPNGVIEAMSCNCVPIISPMDGVADELINDGVDGYILCDEKSCIAISDIDRISKSEEPYKKVSANFSIQRTAEQLSELYNTLM